MPNEGVECPIPETTNLNVQVCCTYLAEKVHKEKY